VLHAALLASPPVREPHRLVQVSSWTGTGGDHFDFSYPLYVDLRDRAEGLSRVAAYVSGTVGIADGDRGERILGVFVTSNYFPLLGVQIPSGQDRDFDTSDRAGSRFVTVINETMKEKVWGALREGSVG
jgi:MacB-like protein